MEKTAQWIAPKLPWAQNIALKVLGGGMAFEGSEYTGKYLIIDAFWRNGLPFSVGNLWRLWVQKHSPESHVLLIGHRPATRQGYCPLYQASQCNFNDLAVKAIDTEKWPVDGQDAVATFQILTKGHGDQSLLRQLTALGSSLDTTLLLLEESDAGQVWRLQKSTLTAALLQLEYYWKNSLEALQPSPLGTWSSLFSDSLQLLQKELALPSPSISTLSKVQHTLSAGTRALSQWQQLLSE